MNGRPLAQCTLCGAFDHARTDCPMEDGLAAAPGPAVNVVREYLADHVSAGNRIATDTGLDGATVYRVLAHLDARGLVRSVSHCPRGMHHPRPRWVLQ